MASDGEFVAIIGPSGCGKSTLFNIVAGLEQAPRGQVLLAGGGARPTAWGPDRLPPPARRACCEWRRVVDNVALSLELQGVGRAEAATAGPPAP